MIGFIVRAALVALGLWVASKIVPGVEVSSIGSLIWAALLLGIVNAIVRPILVVLTFPITIITLGLFLLVINGLMIKLVTLFVAGFVVHGLMPAILCAVIVSLTSWLVCWFIGPQGTIEVVVIRH
ncbi:MAG: phage holin family protein [Alphaproteobacteria bacterium]